MHRSSVATSSRAEVSAAPLQAILAMRDEYRREMACQVVHDSWHERGFTTSYLLHLDGNPAGYGAVGGAPRDPKHTIKEFYVLPPFRGSASRLFQALVAASAARRVEAQTNDPLLLLMLLDRTVDWSSDTILFADRLITGLTAAGASFCRLTAADREGVFPHTHEPVGDYGLQLDGAIVATGGLAFHYNPPYADLYMEVAAPYRRRGLGSYLIQELKRACYELGCVPAARCDRTNIASRATLERAGMLPCGRIVAGTIAA